MTEVEIRMNKQLAKSLGKGLVAFDVGDVLIAEKNYQVVEQCLANFSNGRVVQILGDIHAADLRADCR